MSLLGWILVFSVLGSIGAVLGAALLLVIPDTARERLLPTLVSYATGTLLGAAFLGMVPEAFRRAEASLVSAAILGGILFFFVLEKAVIWRHCHDDACEVHGAPGPLLLIGDAVHNFVDGIVIATAFLVSVPFGITTSNAVIAHEIPQEVGDFAILVKGGYSRRRALLLNTLSSLTTVPGAILAFLFLGQMREAIPFMLAVSAASFIYVAVADLVPELHRRTGIWQGALQILLIGGGIATILLCVVSR